MASVAFIASEPHAAVFHERPKPGEGIAEHRDFFAFLERARLVADRNLDRAVAFADEFDQQLPVEIEAVALKGESVEAVATENLIHGERVLQPDAERRVELNK